MARLDDTEIGGREYGAVRLRPLGQTTEEDARAYEHVGRQLLGDFKRELQLGEVRVGQRETRLPDGTFIRVLTNMAGPAHIDEIHVERGAKSSSKFRVFGYIVQVFLAAESLTPSTSTIKSKVTLPGKDVLGALLGEDDGKKTVSQINALPYIGFPDNGAYYVENNVTSTFPKPEMQTVIVESYQLAGQRTGLVPKVAYKMDGAYSFPGIHPDWEIVHSSYSSSTTCGASPFTFTLNWYFNIGYTLPDLYGSTVVSRYTYNAVGAKEVDICAQTTAQPSDGTAYAGLLGDWSLAVGNYYGPATEQINAINTAFGLYTAYAEGRPNSYDDSYYEMFSSSVKATEVVRRSDDKGFYSDSGLVINPDGTYTFTMRSGTRGNGVIFMIPLKKKHLFNYSDDITAIANNVTEIDSQHSLAYTLGSVDEGHSQAIENIYGPLTLSPENVVIGYTGGYETWHDVEGPKLAESFGLPLKVEEGVHKVEIQDGTPEVNDNRKAYIYAYTSIGVFRFTVGSIKTTAANFGWRSWDPIHIRVGDVTSMNDIVF